MDNVVSIAVFALISLATCPSVYLGGPPVHILLPATHSPFKPIFLYVFSGYSEHP